MTRIAVFKEQEKFGVLTFLSSSTIIDQSGTHRLYWEVECRRCGTKSESKSQNLRRNHKAHPPRWCKNCKGIGKRKHSIVSYTTQLTTREIGLANDRAKINKREVEKIKKESKLSNQ